MPYIDQPPVLRTARPVNYRKLLLLGVTLLIAAHCCSFWENRHLVRPTEIYQGVTYGCDRLSADRQGRGLVHWVEVDLTAPGIELYVTPLDAQAVDSGWQYRLQTTGSVVNQERLAVCINACLFSSESNKDHPSGTFGSSIETVIADHRVSHVWEHTYLLWFDDDLSPCQEMSKPPSANSLKSARWAIGGQSVGLRAGRIVTEPHTVSPDCRTAVGIDRRRMRLYLAVFESATPRRAMEKLAALGAQEGMLLDGGDSTSMTLGHEARGIDAGTVFVRWRPAVATHFGVRALPLEKRR